MKCTELVIYDHLILRRGLDILDGMVNKLESGLRIEIADISAILKFLRVFGDDYHQSMEERALFPALLRSAPQERTLPQMLFEHCEERALVAGIEDALRYKRGMPFAQGSRRLVVLLRDHVTKEDVFLRNLTETALSLEQDDVVLAEFTKNRMQPETLVNFSRLERKYAPKPFLDPVSSTDARSRAPAASI